MAFRPLSTANTTGTNYNQINDMIRDLNKEQKVKVIKDEEGTRVLIMDKNGLRTTAVGGGIDVVTAEDSDLTFNSAQNVFKIARTGVLNITTQSTIASPGAGNYGSDTGYLRTISHGLGYVPAVIAYIEFSSGLRAPLPYQVIESPSASTAVWVSFFTVVNSTTFSLGFNRMVYGVGSLTFLPPYSIRYYLLQETAS